MTKDSSPTRIERDSMGEVHVPSDALYRAQTQRAVNNFPISGLRIPRAMIRALGLIKTACAETNNSLGMLPDDVCAAIKGAAAEVASGQQDSHFPVDIFQTGSGTSSNMNTNEVIATLAEQHSGLPVHPNDHVNMGQSSNDVIPTAIHIAAALQTHDVLVPALKHLQASIEAKASGLMQTTKTGRTHLMDAMPITLGQELSGWASQIKLGIDRIESCSVRIRELTLGGTAVGTGINSHPDFSEKFCADLSHLCDIKFTVKPNFFEGLSAQDAAVELSGQLKTVAVSMMKISNDLRWMNSGPLTGLGEIALPALQPGSSIMPGKVNPVIPEAVAMVCAQVIGNDTTITVGGQSGNFQLNVMLPVIAYNLIQSIEILASASRQLADQAIDGFTVNEDNLSGPLTRNPILVTALNSVIGYDKAAAIAKQAYAEGRPILEVAADATDLSKDELKKLLDPLRLTKGGIPK